METYCVNLGTFQFNIDGFNFNESFFETLDIAEILDIVGFNTKSSINEINKINEIDVDILKTTEKKVQVTNQKQTKKIRANKKIENIIGDKSVVKILKNSKISNYGDLKLFLDDFTAIKGVGTKTANKIKNILKDK